MVLLTGVTMTSTDECQSPVLVSLGRLGLSFGAVRTGREFLPRRAQATLSKNGADLGCGHDTQGVHVEPGAL